MHAVERWHSDRLHEPITLERWGHWGRPVLVFPTAGGDSGEIDRFHLIGALAGLLEAGRIKVYSCDSIAGRTWITHDDPRHASWKQCAFDAAVYHEVVPAIRADCGGADLDIIAAGASIGAFNAVAALCRHPDVFGAAVGMSGTYDLEKWLHGQMNPDFYFSSPLHFLPNLQGGPQLDLLRRRFAVLAFGQGRWESPAQSWRMAEVLGAKGIPNRVDPWGPEWDHDWPSWRRMLPQYLDELTR